MNDVARFLQSGAQGASNAAASTVSMPVDAIAWLLKRAGLPVGEPVGGSDWMARQGLTAQPQNALAGNIGSAAMGFAPMAGMSRGAQAMQAIPSSPPVNMTRNALEASLGTQAARDKTALNALAARRPQFSQAEQQELEWLRSLYK